MHHPSISEFEAPRTEMFIDHNTDGIMDLLYVPEHNAKVDVIKTPSVVYQNERINVISNKYASDESTDAIDFMYLMKYDASTMEHRDKTDELLSRTFKNIRKYIGDNNKYLFLFHSLTGELLVDQTFTDDAIIAWKLRYYAR